MPSPSGSVLLCWLGEVQSTLPSATTSEEAGLAPLLMTLGPALAAAAGSGGGRGNVKQAHKKHEKLNIIGRSRIKSHYAVAMW